MLDTMIDDGLIRVLGTGLDAMPDDLSRLLNHLRTVEDLLSEKASEIEPCWEMAEHSAREIETLQELECRVLNKAVMVPAETFSDILTKLMIWEALPSCSGDVIEECDRDRLIVSIRRDMEAMLKGGPTAWRMGAARRI